MVGACACWPAPWRSTLTPWCRSRRLHHQAYVEGSQQPAIFKTTALIIGLPPPPPPPPPPHSLHRHSISSKYKHHPVRNQPLACLSAARNIAADNSSTRVQAGLRILLKDQEGDDLVGWLDPNHYNIAHIIILCMHDTIH